jgi:glucose/arabinose dehydrogenase
MLYKIKTMFVLKKHIFLNLVILLFMVPQNLQSQVTIGSTKVDTQSVVTGLDTPWEILWGPDNHIWLTERFGRVSRLNPETGNLKKLVTIEEVYQESESGLLGMALHPDFNKNPYVYLIYNYLENSDIQEKLVRYTFEDNELTSPKVLIEGIEGNSNHNGSRIVIDSLNRLYFSTGDAGNTANSQDTNSLNGKILRMNLDGSIPEDNPFNNSLIWTYGHRNPQGLIIAPNGIMYSSEHGPASDDEMNIIEKGRNYGWPDVMGYCDESSEMDFCQKNNVKEPIAAWTPTLAVAGIEHYHHDSIPEWNNSILMTTLKESELVQLKLSENGKKISEEKRWFDNWFGRLRDVAISPGGKVYLAVSNRDGRGNPQTFDDRIIEFSKAGGEATSTQTVKNKTLEIYPNPLETYSTLTIPEHYLQGTISVYNTQGRLVLQKKASKTRETINTKNLTAGVYIIVLQKGSKKIENKIIIDH